MERLAFLARFSRNRGALVGALVVLGVALLAVLAPLIFPADPLRIVAVQLKTLIADGIATTKLRIEKTMPAYIDWPLTNMWCPQTRKPRTAIPIIAADIIL